MGLPLPLTICTLTTFCTLALPIVTVGLHGSSSLPPPYALSLFHLSSSAALSSPSLLTYVLFVSTVVSAITLSLSVSLDVLVVWKDFAMVDLKEDPGSEALRVLLNEEIRSCVSEAILRISGRKTAIEAAMIPVPGSAVDQIVALTALALMY